MKRLRHPNARWLTLLGLFTWLFASSLVDLLQSAQFIEDDIQALSLDELHGVVVIPAVGADFEDGNDVCMV